MNSKPSSIQYTYKLFIQAINTHKQSLPLTMARYCRLKESSSFEFIWRLANQYGALPPPTVCFRASMEVIRYKLCKKQQQQQQQQQTKVNKQNHIDKKPQIKL
jgi:hypothetical protein